LYGRESKRRRNVCYDRKAQEFGKKHQPGNDSTDMAAAMGIELLTAEQYRKPYHFVNHTFPV
jgi:hypothetical protein